MKTIGLISDVHSNYVALQTVLDYMAGRQVDALLFLGDYITDGPDPQRTLSLLREAAQWRPSFFIRGNREQYLIHHADHPEEVWEAGTTEGALLYTYQRVTQQDLDWFRSMPICHTFSELIACHGAPDQVNSLLDTDGTNSAANDRTWYWLDQIEKPLLVCGHTHRQGITRWPRQISSQQPWPQKTVVNCGSVGLPHNHDALARAALLHQTDCGWQPELLQIPYDCQAILQAYRQSELMEMAPAWSHANCRFIETGHNYILRLIRRTKELAAKRQTGPDSSPERSKALIDLPKELWMQAARDLNLV